MEIYGTFNCNPQSDISQQRLQVQMNNQYITQSLPTTNSGMCYCPNCVSKLELPLTKSFLEQFYRSNVTNDVIIGLGAEGGPNFVCLSKVVLRLYYDLPNITISRISPPAGPADGSTNVTVFGTNFVTSDDVMYCYFGDTKVVANVTSDSTLMCITQKTFPNIIYLSVGIEIEDVPYKSNAMKFKFYIEASLREVRPPLSPLEGNTPIQIFGTFENTGIYRCMFSSFFETKVAVGIFSEKTGAVRCLAPSWSRKENVDLSVSLNGQQFSKPISFTYGDENFVDATLPLICGICAGLIAVCVVSLVIVFWCRYQRKRAIGGGSKMTGNTQVDPRDIEYGECIGRGAYGEVYKGKWRGSLVAVKKLRVVHMGDDFVEGFEREIALMSMLRAPNILQFLGSAFDPPNVIIVMEFMPRGSLHDILHNRNISIEWPRVLDMMADTAKGMTYLHRCRPPVIHRDLKSHNLLVDEYWNVKVCDFGLSTVMKDPENIDTAFVENTDEYTAKCIGTPYWTAPEVLVSLNYTLKADVYSFGVVLWECITREDAYPGMQTYEVIYSVAKEGLRPTIPQGIPHPYVFLMKRCWDENMDARPHFQDILHELEEMKAYGWKGEPIKTLNMPGKSAAKSLGPNKGGKLGKNKGKENVERMSLLGSNHNGNGAGAGGGGPGKRRGMTSVCSYGSMNECEPGSLIVESYDDNSDY